MDVGAVATVSAAVDVIRALADALRSRSGRRAWLALRGHWPVDAIARASPTYTGFGLWSTIDSRPPMDGLTVEDLARVRKRAAAITPAALVIYPRFLLPGADVVLDELFLTQKRRGPGDLKNWTLILDSLPGAGGRGSEASFSVSIRADMSSPVPLLARAVADGGTVEKPVLRNGDHYEITLWIFPDQIGLYSYELSARCISDGRTWHQPLTSFDLLHIGPNPPTPGAIVETMYGMQVSGLHQTIPDHYLKARALNVERMTAPVLPPGRAVFVRGGARAQDMYPMRPRSS